MDAWRGVERVEPFDVGRLSTCGDPSCASPSKVRCIRCRARFCWLHVRRDFGEHDDWLCYPCHPRCQSPGCSAQMFFRCVACRDCFCPEHIRFSADPPYYICDDCDGPRLRLGRRLW